MREQRRDVAVGNDSARFAMRDTGAPRPDLPEQFLAESTHGGLLTKTDGGAGTPYFYCVGPNVSDLSGQIRCVRNVTFRCWLGRMPGRFRSSAWSQDV